MTPDRTTGSQTSDGRYTVKGVPIFALGEHRGWQYDVSWAQRAVALFHRMKRETGYLPPVIIGHTNEGTEEKPAVGFIDDVRLAGKRIVADLVGLSRELFEELRAGRWPYRSIEVFSREARITALALLGGNPPYMKTAPLRFSDDGSESEWLPAVDVSHETPNTQGGPMETVTPEDVKRFSEEEVNVLVDTARAEEKARSDSALRAARQKIERLEADAETTQQEKFGESLRQLSYAPALVDMPEMTALFHVVTQHDGNVHFGDGEVAPRELLERVLEQIAHRSAHDTAFVRTGSAVTSQPFRRFWDDDGKRDLPQAPGRRADPASVDRLSQAQRLAKDEGISFRDALIRVMEG
jgi:hypothetical protein